MSSLWQRWERKLKDRLGEPLHLNALSALVRLFGGFRMQVEFDLIERRRYAFALLQAADWAKRYGENHNAVVNLRNEVRQLQERPRDDRAAGVDDRDADRPQGLLCPGCGDRAQTE